MNYAKTINATIFFCFVFAIQIQAQVKLGFLTGASSVMCECSGLAEPGEFYLGAFGGFIVSKIISNKWDFNTEIIVTEKGFNFINLGAIAQDKEKGYYIDFTASIDYKIATKFYLTGGVQFNYKFLDYRFEDDQWNSILSEDAILKSFDYSFVLGAKLRFEKWFISTRLNKGLANISNIADPGPNITRLYYGPCKNQTIQLGIGYYFKK